MDELSYTSVHPGIYIDCKENQYLVLDLAVDIDTGARLTVFRHLYIDGRGIYCTQSERNFAARIASGELVLSREFP